MAKLNSKTTIVLGVLLLLVLVSLTFSFTYTSLSLSPTNATTENDLVCTWNLTGSTDQVNVTWYNNSVQYDKKIGVLASSDTLDSSFTKRGDTWNCTVHVKNSTLLEVMSEKVTIVNADPYPPSISNQTLYEDQLWSTSLSATDPDGDSVTYICLPADTLDQCTAAGSLQWTPSQSDIGTYNLSFVAFDFPEDGSSVKRVMFNVTPVNDRPSFSTSISNQSVSENETLQYLFTVTDEENATGPFNFTMNSSFDPERLEYSTSDDKNFIVQFLSNGKALYTDVGNWTVNVTACDPENNSLCVDGSFNLEVLSINHAPVFSTVENKSATQGQSFNLSFNASDVDTSDTLTFAVLTPNCAHPNPWLNNITTINSSSNATGIVNVTILNNTHVVCRNITLTVTDSKITTSQLVYLNLSNTNDPPVIYNYSYYAGNTQGNTDINNLTGYTNTQFIYQVNGTDIDSYTYESEVLTYDDNSSLCAICPGLNMSTSTGIISFTPNTSHIGNFSYTVNVTDDQGLFVSKVLSLEIINNTPPYFNPDVANQTVNESDIFVYDINATDTQGNEIYFTDDSALFAINNSGYINFTPSCTEIGNYTIAITITDDFGAYTADSFNLEIIHEPDAPILQTVVNRTILEEKPFYINIGGSTTDADATCNLTENLTYSSSFINGSTLFVIDSATGIISFTPNSSSEGNYLIQINVTDLYNLSDSLIWNISVANRTNAPVIHNITPYGYPTVFSWINLTSLGANMTTVNATENSSIIFNHTSSDSDSDPLIYRWYLDNVLVGSSVSLNYDWDYNSYGIHSITLNVTDNVSGILDNTVSFTWNTTIANLNRPPVINASLPNVTINGTIVISNYLSGVGWGETRFSDPDGDTLSYTYTNNSVVTLSFTGDSATFVAQVVNTTVILITASDGEFSVNSNNITINVSALTPQETVETSSGTSTSTRTRDSLVPYSVIQEVEKEVEVYFDIIKPEKVTIYKNNTLWQLIKLVNKGNQTLRGISVSAQTNSSSATLSFSTDYFSELLPGQEVFTDLVIEDYKLLTNYEILIFANITEPSYADKAVIYVNAIEKSKGNQSVSSTKITFAQDLLSSNPECIELNEFLKKAKEQMDLRDYEKAAQITHSVIQGCKYLVSQSKLKEEKPTGWVFNIDLNSSPIIIPAIGIFIIGMIAAVYLTVRAKKGNDEESEE